MPKDVYREESIDKMVDLIKYHMVHNVFVFVDASYHQIHRGARDAGDDYADNEGHKTPVQQNKGRKSAASASKRKSVGSATPKKAAVPKAARTVNGLLSGTLTQLANLLYVVHLPDATVLQLTNLGISALLVDDVDLIQAKAVDMVVAAFKQYPVGLCTS
jgi:cohesin loading factor subunit SCC2